MLINHLMDQSSLLSRHLPVGKAGDMDIAMSINPFVRPYVCVYVCGNFVALRRDYYDDNYD